MIKVLAAPEDEAKEKIECAMFARMTLQEGKLPTYFILTYNEQSHSLHIHGANRAEELNLTLSYFPDDALLAVVNNVNPDNSDAGREQDTILDLIADPVIAEHLNYCSDRKEFLPSEFEQAFVARRNEGLKGLPAVFEGPAKSLAPKTKEDDAPKPRGAHLKLVIDNDL